MLKSDLRTLKDNLNFTVGYMESWLKQIEEDANSSYLMPRELYLSSQKRRLEDLLPRLQEAAKIANLTQELK